MPHAVASDGVKLYYEEVGQGTPIVFVHEFADDVRGWAPQVKFFARRYRTVAFLPSAPLPRLSAAPRPRRSIDLDRSALVTP